MELVIFGAPGVGKGTQAKILSAKLGIPHISTGDILREAVRNKTEYGRKAEELMRKGSLVPDDIIAAMVKERLKSPKCSGGYILDGFPRTENQGKLFIEMLKELNRELPVFVKLKADADEIVRRLTNRRACTNCESIVNILTLADSEKCPNCGAEGTLAKRDDDEEDVIRHRLDVYRESTKPVLEFFKGKVHFEEIYSIRNVNEITEDIIRVVKQNYRNPSASK